MDNKELIYLKESANNGNVSSQLKLADIYFDGEIVERDFSLALHYYKKAALNNSADAYNFIGLMYQDGLGTTIDYEKAVENFKMAASLGCMSANNNLGYLYLNGLGVEKNYNKAYELLSLKKVKDNYILNILSKLIKGNSIYYVDNLSTLLDDKYSNLNDDDIIVLNTDSKINYYGYYDYKTIKEIIKIIKNDILNIDLNKNEAEKFYEVYIKLARLLLFDSNAYDFENHLDYMYEVATTSRNLMGLINKECVCAGFANILKNVLALINIECIILSSDDHDFNKVKIFNEWYYCDLTQDSINIKKYDTLKYCLLCKKDFEDSSSHIAIYNPQDSCNDSIKSYDFDDKKTLA